MLEVDTREGKESIFYDSSIMEDFGEDEKKQNHIKII